MDIAQKKKKNQQLQRKTFLKPKIWDTVSSQEIWKINYLILIKEGEKNPKQALQYQNFPGNSNSELG